MIRARSASACAIVRRPAGGLIERLSPAKALFADAAYDSNAFCEFLAGRGTTGHQTQLQV